MLFFCLFLLEFFIFNFEQSYKVCKGIVRRRNHKLKNVKRVNIIKKILVNLVKLVVAKLTCFAVFRI